MVTVAATLAESKRLLAEQTFHFVLLDLMLPDGNGMEILQRLAQDNNAQCVIVTTASSNPDRLREAEELRPRSILRKPIELIDLLGAMGMM